MTKRSENSKEEKKTTYCPSPQSGAWTRRQSARRRPCRRQPRAPRSARDQWPRLGEGIEKK